MGISKQQSTRSDGVMERWSNVQNTNTPILHRSNTRTSPASFLLLNNNIPIFVHNCLLLRLNQRGRIQLFDNRRAGYFMPGFETVTSVNLCGQCAVLLAEEYFALTGLCFVDFTTRHLSR